MLEALQVLVLEDKHLLVILHLEERDILEAVDIGTQQL